MILIEDFLLACFAVQMLSPRKFLSVPQTQSFIGSAKVLLAVCAFCAFGLPTPRKFLSVLQTQCAIGNPKVLRRTIELRGVLFRFVICNRYYRAYRP